MNKNAIEGRILSFGAVIVGAIAVFIFSAVFAAPRAHAYAIGPLPTGTASGGYDFAGSLQNLFSPFTGFINNLKWKNNTTINTHGEATGTWPTVNVTPIVASGAQNILTRWFGKFDDWFYGMTGMRLSGIFSGALNVFAWMLGLAHDAIGWMRGLFH